MPALRAEHRVPAAVSAPGPCFSPAQAAEWSAQQRAAEDAALAYWRSVPIEISARRLSPADKQRVWKHLQATAPDRVAFLTDPAVRELVARGWAPLFTIEECRAAGVSV